VDIAKEYVNCVDYEGNIRWQANIKGPRGIVINGDSLFVASKTENAIFQIDRGTGKYSCLPSYISFIIYTVYILLCNVHNI
jgi:hypothetical protein